MTSITKFCDEINEYLDSKIPNVGVCTRREIAVHISGMALLRDKDVVEDTARMMKNSMKSKNYRIEQLKRNTEKLKHDITIDTAIAKAVGGSTRVE